MFVNLSFYHYSLKCKVHGALFQFCHLSDVNVMKNMKCQFAQLSKPATKYCFYFIFLLFAKYLYILSDLKFVNILRFVWSVFSLQDATYFYSQKIMFNISGTRFSEIRLKINILALQPSLL